MQTVVLTPRHRIVGELNTRNQRLSDFLNDRSESTVRLEKATVSRLTDPDTAVEHQATVVIHKRAALVIFGIADPFPTSPQRFYARVAKRQQEAMLLIDTLEVRGRLHTSQALDIGEIQRLVTSPGHFLPVTDAVVSVDGVREHDIHQEAIIVNVQHIRFIAKAEDSA